MVNVHPKYPEMPTPFPTITTNDRKPPPAPSASSPLSLIVGSKIWAAHAASLWQCASAGGLLCSDAAREIMKTNEHSFSCRPKSSIADKNLYAKDMAFAPYGEYWRQIRSIAVLHLLSNRKVWSFRGVRAEEAALWMEKIKSSCSAPLNFSEMLPSFTNDVSCRIALGRKQSEREGEKKFKDLLGDFVKLWGVFDVGDYMPWLAWLNRVNGLYAQVGRVAKELDQLMEGVVEEHMINNYQNGEGSCDDRKTL